MSSGSIVGPHKTKWPLCRKSSEEGRPIFKKSSKFNVWVCCKRSSNRAVPLCKMSSEVHCTVLKEDVPHYKKSSKESGLTADFM